MPPPSGLFSGSVADLFATLGLDSSGLTEGLRKGKVAMMESGKDVLSLMSLLKQLEHQAGPVVAIQAFQQLNAQLNQSTAALFRWQREVVPALREANAAMAASGAVPGAVAGAAGGVGGGGGGGASLLVTRLTERFLIYQGLRFAVQGFTAALHEADDITRRMDQTGWGSEGIQRFQLAAERLHVPVDQATASIARFEEKIDSGDLSAIKALDRLGLRFTDVRRQMAADPQAGLENVFARMNTITNQGEFADSSFALFQDRSGKMLAFIREYERLKKDASKSPILSDEDRKAVESLNWFLQRMGQLGSVGLGKVVSGFLSGPGFIDAPVGAGALGGVTRGRFQPFGPPLLNTSAGSPLGGANSPSGDASGQLRTLLDEFRAPHEIAMRKLNEDWNTMLLLERQGLATHAQVIEFSRRASAKLAEEAQAVIDAQIRKDVSLLTEFGAQGKRTTELMARDFKELQRVFVENRISVEEMTEATANYFNMLEENAMRPALKQAIRMFEQGLIGPDELLRARARANALGMRGTAEAAFERGEIGPGELMDAQRQFRRGIFENAPDRGSRFFLGPNGSILTEPKRDSLPMLSPSDVVGPQGNVNIVPLDQFSETMVRRWKQQGTLGR